MPLAWFTIRVVGALLAPFAVQTAFLAYGAPTLHAHGELVFLMAISAGLLFLIRRINVKTVAIGIAYVLVMGTAVMWWTFFAAGTYFPNAWTELGLGRGF